MPAHLRPAYAQAQVTAQTANTSRNPEHTALVLCYSRCMISPNQGDLTGFRVQGPSDTLKPHIRLLAGMQNRHPGPASGRGGCHFLAKDYVLRP